MCVMRGVLPGYRCGTWTALSLRVQNLHRLEEKLKSVSGQPTLSSHRWLPNVSLLIQKGSGTVHTEVIKYLFPRRKHLANIVQ